MTMHDQPRRKRTDLPPTEWIRSRACGCLSGGAEGQGRFPGSTALRRRSAGQSSLVELVEQAGLALVASVQFQEWFGERGRVALPGGERLQVP